MIGDPKVSVVIPAYNSADYTVETVESVLAQTYRNREIIVVDDGSTDHTHDELKRFGDEIKYIYKENGGACSARNLGIGESTGEYVACLDCDDLWLPDKLEYSVAMLDHNPDLALSFTACDLIDGAGEKTGQVECRVDLSKAYKELLYQNYITAPTVVMRRSCLESVGRFDERIFIPADWDLWLRLARRYPIGYIDQSLSQYRVTSAYSQRNLKQLFAEAMYVLDKNMADSPELSVKERDKVYDQMFVICSKVSLDAGQVVESRRMLLQAINRNPYKLRSYLLFLLTYLGRGFKSAVGNRIASRLCRYGARN
jgi:glycosyltransferase involved in cell wall biosynthesis